MSSPSAEVILDGCNIAGTSYVAPEGVCTGVGQSHILAGGDGIASVVGRLIIRDSGVAGGDGASCVYDRGSNYTESGKGGHGVAVTGDVILIRTSVSGRDRRDGGTNVFFGKCYTALGGDGGNAGWTGYAWGATGKGGEGGTATDCSWTFQQAPPARTPTRADPSSSTPARRHSRAAWLAPRCPSPPAMLGGSA